ncbi:MAG: hypothetical protein ACD_66C00205G0002 [uncultured bacterium]|nr:MAG: hypothetical protein ACD_66C00205G0002 [uncultured bacterium]
MDFYKQKPRAWPNKNDIFVKSVLGLSCAMHATYTTNFALPHGIAHHNQIH